jgi:hypothetical protein
MRVQEVSLNQFVSTTDTKSMVAAKLNRFLRNRQTFIAIKLFFHK